MFRAIWLSIQLEKHFLLFPHALFWVQICAFTLQCMYRRSLYNIRLVNKKMAFKMMFSVVIVESNPVYRLSISETVGRCCETVVFPSQTWRPKLSQKNQTTNFFVAKQGEGIESCGRIEFYGTLHLISSCFSAEIQLFLNCSHHVQTISNIEENKQNCKKKLSKTLIVISRTILFLLK